MASEDTVTDALLDAIAEAATPLQMVSIKVLSTGPLRVSINGAGSVLAEAWSGHSFSTNDTGRALWSPPSKPVCFKVT